MGLDLSHDAWHGAYSAYSRWRAAVAAAAGYPVVNGQPDLDWSSYVGENFQGHWHGRELLDPILYLLVHSDCDGVLKPKHAALVADRLTELMPLMPEGDGGGHIGDWRATTQKFIDGLRLAVSQNKKVKFQ